MILRPPTGPLGDPLDDGFLFGPPPRAILDPDPDPEGGRWPILESIVDDLRRSTPDPDLDPRTSLVAAALARHGVDLYGDDLLAVQLDRGPDGVISCRCVIVAPGGGE